MPHFRQPKPFGTTQMEQIRKKQNSIRNWLKKIKHIQENRYGCLNLLDQCMQSHLQIEEHNFLQYEIFKWSSIDKTECNVKKKKKKFCNKLTILIACFALRYQISKISYHFICSFRFTFLNIDLNMLKRCNDSTMKQLIPLSFKKIQN